MRGGYLSIFLTFLYVFGVTSGAKDRVAGAHLISGNVKGSIIFTETNDGVHVTGAVKGLEAGAYGFHVHELGDVSTCDATGAHFNPEGTTHGGRDHSIRHVGDLGNIHFDANGTAIVNFTDKVIALRGRNNVLGRGLVLHEQEDDLGLSGHPTSLTTGNAGPRIACATIGMHAPVDAWNSARNVIPSITMIIFTVVTIIIK